MSIEELLKEEWNGGARVVNCVAHMNLVIDARPEGCRLCLTDLQNSFRYALRVNEWLNSWKGKATEILKAVQAEDRGK